ncbi:MFS transporter [Chitinolyticbacter albus]|uniref:MFS transporter n=1 Tax=Chitinolyticbacter albus TaxID=2961951 RepID=UPI00210872D2|nr:MFS transporter [Chitinolyticbacter albus]
MNVPSASRSIALIACVQFVYIVDFMMVLPLGPDLARALGFGSDRLGWLTAAYTIASVLSAALAMRWLDRFERKRALLVALALCALATLAAVWAHDLTTLLLARAAAGFFGGPAVALGMAIVIDSTAPQARGAAIAKVMIGFSLAAIAGVPAALELARLGGWTLPFIVTALLAALAWLAVALVLPEMRTHLAQTRRLSARMLLARPAVRIACAAQALSQFSAFLLIPHFSAYWLLNLGFARERLGLLYLAGGACAFALIQLLGRWTDRRGPWLPALLASSLLALGALPFLGLAAGPLVLPFVCFMAGNAGRNVTLAAVTSQVPEPHERAGFMALQSMVQDMAIAAAALVASGLLCVGADGALTGTPQLAVLALAGIAALPVVLQLLLRRVPVWAAA